MKRGAGLMPPPTEKPAKLTTRVVATVDLWAYGRQGHRMPWRLWARAELAKQGIKFTRATFDPDRDIEQDIAPQFWVEQGVASGVWTVTQVLP